MKCPFRFRGRYFDLQTTDMVGGDCLKEECAWWDDIREKCSILSISITLLHFAYDADARALEKEEGGAR